MVEYGDYLGGSSNDRPIDGMPHAVSTPEFAKPLLIDFLRQENEILDTVASYPDFDDCEAFIAVDTLLINNPEYRVAMSIAVPDLHGLTGFRQADLVDGVAIELERVIDEDSIYSYPPELGITSPIGLVVGIYSDQETLELMRRYVNLHPSYEGRLVTNFVIDEHGSAVKYFYAPKDFPINPSGRVAVIERAGNEKVVYDNLQAMDIEVIGMSLALLQQRLSQPS